MSFVNNGNSFDSCFQLVGQHPNLDLELRVKAYCKILQLLQSKSVTKAIGMNTKGIFQSSMSMLRKLRDSCHEGLSRIELTYTAGSRASEEAFFNGVFPDQAKVDLNRVQPALNRVAGISWHLSTKNLLDHFTAGANGRQLLVVQRTLVGLIYAVNSKPKCFTGFFQKAPLAGHFKWVDFLASQALPGPDSIVNCVIQRYGPVGPTEFKTVVKRTPLSEIPGIKHSTQENINLPRPPAWDNKKLTLAAKQAVSLSTLGRAVWNPRKPESVEQVIETLDPRLHDVLQFCEREKITKLKDLQDAPKDIQALLDDHTLRPLILKYLFWRANQANAATTQSVREYADKEELERMESCHQRCIEVLKCFLGGIRPRALFRALNVAGGNGRLSSTFLLQQYGTVDLFDQCAKAVKLARQAMRRNISMGIVQECSMQDFRWPCQYSGIFMVWCAGYLAREDLVAFLQKAKANLMQGAGRFTRLSTPEAFIFLLDNVLAEDEEPWMEKGQRVRSEEQLETILEDACLTVHRRSERQAMPGTYRDVVLLALY